MHLKYYKNMIKEKEVCLFRYPRPEIFYSYFYVLDIKSKAAHLKVPNGHC